MKISVVSCVNDVKLYDYCVEQSFKGDDNVELIPIMNVNNEFSAPQALNKGIALAQHEIVVCCHQDVRFPDPWLEMLENQISIIRDFEFGVLGTFGVNIENRLEGNVIDPHRVQPSEGLPMRAQTLDEHCLILRRSGPLRFDEQLGGFHFYGADICFQAHSAGLKCYIIDAQVEHLSGGRLSKEFNDMKEKFTEKWKESSVLPAVHTTCCTFLLR